MFATLVLNSRKSRYGKFCGSARACLRWMIFPTKSVHLARWHEACVYRQELQLAPKPDEPYTQFRRSIVEPESSMMVASMDIRRIAAPTDRRPDFIAEALPPRFRIGLLVTTLLAEAVSVIAVTNAVLWPGGPMSVDGVFGALLVGATLVTTFAVLLVFGALVANNPRLTSNTRIAWYALFAVLGPVMIPAYWLMHVWPTPFEPEHPVAR